MYGKVMKALIANALSAYLDVDALMIKRIKMESNKEVLKDPISMEECYVDNVVEFADVLSYSVDDLGAFQRKEKSCVKVGEWTENTSSTTVAYKFDHLMCWLRETPTCPSSRALLSDAETAFTRYTQVAKALGDDYVTSCDQLKSGLSTVPVLELLKKMREELAAFEDSLGDKDTAAKLEKFVTAWNGVDEQIQAARQEFLTHAPYADESFKDEVSVVKSGFQKLRENNSSGAFALYQAYKTSQEYKVYIDGTPSSYRCVQVTNEKLTKMKSGWVSEITFFKDGKQGEPKYCRVASGTPQIECAKKPHMLRVTDYQRYSEYNSTWKKGRRVKDCLSAWRSRRWKPQVPESKTSLYLSAALKFFENLG